jgi:hypothetical protein
MQQRRHKTAPPERRGSRRKRRLSGGGSCGRRACGRRASGRCCCMPCNTRLSSRFFPPFPCFVPHGTRNLQVIHSEDFSEHGPRSHQTHTPAHSQDEREHHQSFLIAFKTRTTSKQSGQGLGQGAHSTYGSTSQDTRCATLSSQPARGASAGRAGPDGRALAPRSLVSAEDAPAARCGSLSLSFISLPEQTCTRKGRHAAPHVKVSASPGKPSRMAPLAAHMCSRPALEAC